MHMEDRDHPLQSRWNKMEEWGHLTIQHVTNETGNSVNRIADEILLKD